MVSERLGTSRGICSSLAALLLIFAIGGAAGGAIHIDRGPAPTRFDPAAITGSVTGPPAGGVVLVTAARARSCPLSLPEQEKAIKIFAKMGPVFRHPRCSNCHGGVQPFEEPGKGNHPVQMEDKGGGIGCEECHELSNPLGSPGWRLAPQRVHWTSSNSAKPASDQALCLQVKAAAKGSAQRYVNHFVDDNGGTRFIEAAFHGIRALNEGAQDMVENFKAEPPPGTLNDLIQHSKDYVNALGGELVGGPECGCIRGKIELIMKSEWVGTGEGRTMTAPVTVTVPLTPDSSGLVFTGQAPLKHGRYTVTTPPGCRVDMKPAGGELSVSEARFEITGEKGMLISLAVNPTMSGGTMAFVCPKLPKSMGRLPIMPWTGNWQYVHKPDLIGRDYHFDEFDAAPGVDFGGERKLIGSKEVSRKTSQHGMTVTAKTTFEFWWLGLPEYE